MSGTVAETVEAAVVGSLLVDAGQLAAVRAVIPGATVFADTNLAAIYDAMLILADRGDPIDHVTLVAQLQPKRLENLDIVLADLIDEACAPSNAGTYAKMVADRFRRRSLGEEAVRLGKLLADPGIAVDVTVAETVSRLAASARPAHQRITPALSPLLLTVLDQVEQEAKHGRSMAGLSSGFDSLDALTDGFCAGDVLILAARPSEGKTSLALRMGRAAAALGPVLVISREMPAIKLARRLLQAELGKNLKAFRDAGELDRWAGRLAQAAGVVAKLKLHIDCAAETPSQVRFTAQCLQAREGALALIVVDYLQLLRPDSKESTRDREIGSMSAALKRMAVDLGVPVIVLSQLTRNSAKESRAPELFDLRDSGTIEQDADLVAMLHWPNGMAERGPTGVDVHLRKNRDGERGMVSLLFETWTGRWHEPNRPSRIHDEQYELQQSA